MKLDGHRLKNNRQLSFQTNATPSEIVSPFDPMMVLLSKFIVYLIRNKLPHYFLLVRDRATLETHHTTDCMQIHP